jgi:hypothetical protein
MVEEWGIGKEELRRRRLVEVWLGIGKDLRLVRKTMIREKRGNLSREGEDKWSKRWDSGASSMAHHYLRIGSTQLWPHQIIPRASTIRGAVHFETKSEPA